MKIYLSAPGAICCAGADRRQLFDAACRGDQSGIKSAAVSGRPFRVGRVPELPALPALSEGMAPTRLLALAAAALEQIRPEIEAALSRYGKGRVGVCAGSCDNGSELSMPAHRRFFADGEFPADYDLRFQSAGFPAARIAEQFDLSGPAMAIATACSSGASAVVQGSQLIRAGICDAVIAGGVDIASETALLGFDALEAVSDGICNPFSRNRNGITLGEGAAFFVMSREALAGDPVALLGFGESADAVHMTAPCADASGAIRAMRRALASAGIAPAEVDYINLHGTGTALNDQMEARAVAEVFQGALPPVSSTKPITGHTLGAAGALELALCWTALRWPGPSGALLGPCRR